MSRATSLTVIAVGAILAFAVTASPRFLNLQVVGWILMATGAAGLLLERRSRDWLRRTVIVRGSPDIARYNRRRQAQIAPPASSERPSADGATQPLGEPVERATVERETIEEYMEP
ncbi:MAG TPA: DUF6458 family protein [Streptosporangiaceae bacterium]|nr:DUF6458 family protein [Streptosporangiaceae bacterium]